MNNMNKSDLKKLSKSQLIKMLLKQEKKKPEIIIVDDTKPQPYKPVPTPRKSVNQLVQNYENKIILPPQEFRKPVPIPRTKIEKTEKALKGYTESYKINRPTNATTKHKKGCRIPYYKRTNIHERIQIC